MAKTSEANSIGTDGGTRATEARAKRKLAEIAAASGHAASGENVRHASRSDADGAGGDEAISEAEHLKRDFARVRANVAKDSVVEPGSLSTAWTTDVMEEDEAEFVDAVADCLGAGFSLESALTGWDAGTLAAEGQHSQDDSQEDGSLFDETRAFDDEPSLPASTPARRITPPGARRVFVT